MPPARGPLGYVLPVANVSALVLIYDIRGFTAASKRMGTANLGAFATGAHKAILDLFTAIPPTFVKNLGDGHLLLWETSATPDPTLVGKVVEGAKQARLAFAAFVAGQGAAGERLPRHVGVGVAVGEVSRSDDYYGVALNLAARLQNLARPEGLALDASVFEAAASRDQAMRVGFQRARVRLKGLGSTLVWVRRPFSWARLWKSLWPAWAAIGLALAWVGLADARVGVPGGASARRWLDRHGLSLMRPVASEAEVRAGADRLRRAVTEHMLAARTEGGWIRGALGDPSGKEAMELDVWSSSQSFCALVKAAHLSVDDLRPLLHGLEASFEGGRFVEVGSKAYGWTAHVDADQTEDTEVEPGLWTVAALASALARPGLVPEGRRAAFEGLLARAQRAALTYYPVEDGGWNPFPDQVEATVHSPYSTALALLALLETREAGLGWTGSLERRDALLDATLRRTVETFEEREALPGWRRTGDARDQVSPGLTLQNYALLLRAETLVGFPLPDRVREAMTRQLAALEGISMEQPPDAGEFGQRFVSRFGGRVVHGRESINFLWHPWAIDTATRWLERADRRGALPEERAQIGRARAHLVIGLGPDAIRATRATWTFISSETVYALQGIPPP